MTPILRTPWRKSAPASGALEVSVTSSLDDVRAADWDAVCADGFVASTHAWQSRFAKIPIAAGSQPVFFFVRKAGEPIAAAAGLEFRYPLALFARGRSRRQLALLASPLAAMTTPQVLLLGPMWSLHRCGLFLRPGADPHEVAPALRDAFARRKVEAVIATGIPAEGDDAVVELAREAVGGVVFPWLQYAQMPAMKAADYFKTLPGHRRRQLKYNADRAAQAGLRVELTPALAEHAELVAGLVKQTRAHNLREGRPVLTPPTFERPELYRYIDRSFAPRVELARVLDPQGDTLALDVALHGDGHSVLISWGMRYPAPSRISLYNLLFNSVYERCAARGNSLDLGPYMHTAKALSGARMQPTLARIAMRGVLARPLFERVLAPWVLPDLDVDDWDEHILWPTFLTKVVGATEHPLLARLQQLGTRSDDVLKGQ